MISDASSTASNPLRSLSALSARAAPCSQSHAQLQRTIFSCCPLVFRAPFAGACRCRTLRTASQTAETIAAPAPLRQPPSFLPLCILFLFFLCQLEFDLQLTSDAGIAMARAACFLQPARARARARSDPVTPFGFAQKSQSAIIIMQP